MEVLVVFVIVGLAFGFYMTFRGFRGVAKMSDGQSLWARGAAQAASRCRFRIASSPGSRPLVSMGGQLAIFGEGFALTSPISRLERRHNSIRSIDVGQARGSVTIVMDDLSVSIEDADPLAIEALLKSWRNSADGAQPPTD